MFETAIKLLKLFNDNGYEAYIVGGYLRDLELNINSKDIDICTSATPKEVRELLSKCEVSKESYGCVTAIYEKYKFEITTFRKEGNYKDLRNPSSIKYVKTLEEDIVRRDFTMNTLCMDKDLNLIDLLNAKEDINEKKIKCVGDCNKTITDDALRILRAIRFATVLDFKLADSLKIAIMENKKNLAKLSITRKKDELDKIFNHKNKLIGLNLIKELKLEKYLDITTDVSITTSGIGIWAQQKKDFNFTREEKQLIKNINEALKSDVLEFETLYKYGLYVCQIAGEIKNIDKKIVTEKHILLQITDKSEIVVNVKDIHNELSVNFIEANKLFKIIEKEIINQRLINNKEDILNFLRRTK